MEELLRKEMKFYCFTLSPKARPEVLVPSGEKEVLQSEGTPQTHYFRMRNRSQAFLSGALLEAKLSWAKNNLSGESLTVAVAGAGFPPGLSVPPSRREGENPGLSTALPLPVRYVSLRGEKTKPHLCVPTKNSLSIPFEDLGLSKPARLAKTGLRFSLKN